MTMGASKKEYERLKEEYLANLSPLEKEIYWMGYEDALQRKWEHED